MLQRASFLVLGFLLYCTVAFSQGSISGTVRDAKTNEPIVGANVVIEGTTTGAATDFNGEFNISKVAAGTYNLHVTFITYKAHRIPDVVVENAKKVTIDISMSEDVSELQEVVVTGTRQVDTDFELLRAIKDAKLVMVGISSEQISKTLDRDAAQVLKRVPGITIKDNQFVQVRGLSERYNPVMLHNAYAPSLETDVRSFSFAMIPSSQLDRMLVYKSPSADLPGDFAGGVVKIFTKSIPEENSLIIDYSTQVRAGTTFNDFYHQEKDSQHFTGVNNHFYDLPAWFPSNLNNASTESATNIGKNLKNLWTEQKGKAIPDQRFTITMNKKFNIGKVQIGNISAVNYSNSYTSYAIERGDFATGGPIASRVSSLADKQYSQMIRTGALFNWAAQINENHKIEFKNLLNQSSTDQFVSRTGTSTGRSFDKVYRTIYSSQLLGTHTLFNQRTAVEWVAGYNNSSRQQPDYKRYFVTPDENTGKEQIVVPNSPDPNNLGRFFSKLNEESYSGGLSVKQNFGFSKDPLRSPELKAGVFFENKTRTFGARNIGYTWYSNANPSLAMLPIGELFQPQNFNKQGIALGEDTKRKDSYTASNNLLAYYLMASVPFTSKIKLDAGVRVEDNLQQLHSFDDLRGIPAEPKMHVVKPLPSANLSYNFTDKMLVRGAYGQTLNRPEFRELAPFGFYDFNYSFLYTGNQFLKTATIQNMDLRWELYPSKLESITVGGFYKAFKNPIESYGNINNGGLKEVTFNNAQSATSYGVEVEVKKSLDGLTSSRFINNINFLFNASLIKSAIKLYPDQAVDQESKRPMQGQAPYVINTALFYNSSNSGWQVNLLYNVVGKNIFLVGNKFYADVYMMPRNVVDITFSKNITERFQVKGGVTDILNQPMLLLQDGNHDNKLDRNSDDVIQKFRPGQVFSLGVSWRVY